MEHPFTGCANEVIPFCRTRWPSVTAQESTEKRPVWNWEMRREKVRSHELVTSDHTNSSTLPTWLQLVIYLPLTSLSMPTQLFLEHSTLLSSLGPLCILFSKSVVYFSLPYLFLFLHLQSTPRILSQPSVPNQPSLSAALVSTAPSFSGRKNHVWLERSGF